VRQTASVYEEILDYSNRANPYSLYVELRKTPVSRQEDGTYVISTYDEIVALLHDPRVSSDPRNLPEGHYRQVDGGLGGFIERDPPDHDRGRRQAMRHFGPPHDPGLIDGLRPWFAEVVTWADTWPGSSTPTAGSLAMTCFRASSPTPAPRGPCRGRS